MRKLLCGSVALAAIIAGVPAIAADMPVKAAPVAVASWTGLYVGLGVGFRSTQTDMTVTAETQGGVDILGPICAGFALTGSCVTGQPLNDTAFRSSLYAGYNWQVAPQWVVGVEGDWGFANKTTTLGGMYYPLAGVGGPITGIAADTFAVKTTWDASARARIGFLADPSLLIYATGGAAWLHVEATSSCNVLTGPCSPGGGRSPAVVTDSTTKSGWTIGGGIEAMLWANWIARAEYRYADFGTISNTDIRTEAAGPSPNAVSYDLRVRTHTATFGLAYKFGAESAVTAALPVKAPIYKAPPVAVASWSGPYVGLGIGIRSTKTDATVTAFTSAGFDLLALNCAILAPFGGCVTGEPLNDTAFRLSPYVGFIWQVAPWWVVGLEGDWGFANKTTTLNGMAYPVTGFIDTNAADSFSVKTTWDASARGRVGYLVNPSVLIYATGGAAWLHVESTSNCNPIFGNCDPISFRPAVIAHATTKLGWTIGGGIEAMMWGNWIVRGEYRYADFGTISNTDTRINGFSETQVVSYDLRVKTHTATFGLAYKFDWSTPVVVKY